MLFSVNNNSSNSNCSRSKKETHTHRHTSTSEAEKKKEKKKNNVSYATNYTLLIPSTHTHTSFHVYGCVVCAILLISSNMMKSEE